MLHPESQPQFDSDCQALAHDARANPKLWKKFWALKELFHEIKYAYAITAHRSQGSTYEQVFVDYQDILYNRNRKEAFQCLYVACSRPTLTRLLHTTGFDRIVPVTETVEAAAMALATAGDGS